MRQLAFLVVQHGLVVCTLVALLNCAPADADPMPTSRATQTPVYRDGTYTATGTYGSLPSHLTVTVYLRQGLIEKVQLQTPATDPTSLGYQRAFAEAVPRVVVGKPLGEVKVGKLAGASGCPVGFNDALARIRQQAAR